MKTNKWIIILGCIVLFLLSVWCGFIVNSYINFSKKSSENSAILAENIVDENSVKTNAYQEAVSPNAEVIATITYKRCGHIISRRTEAPREIINLCEDDVKEYYKNWNLDKFSSKEIFLSKEEKGICDEHYVLRESNGYISISSKNDIGEYIFKGMTDIPVQYLPEEDMNKLELGIEIVRKDNLNKFLEDFE